MGNEKLDEIQEMKIETANLRSLIEIYATGMETLNDIWNSIPALMFIKDNHNKMVRVNDCFCRYSGLEKKEIEGKSAEELTKNHILAAKYAENDISVFKSKKAKIGIIEKLFDTEITIRTDKLPIIKNGVVIGILGLSVIIND